MRDTSEERLRELFRRADMELVPGRLDRAETMARARRQRVRRVGALSFGVLLVLALVAGTSLVLLGPEVEQIRPVGPGGDAKLPPAPEGWTTYDDGRIAFHHPQEWSVLLAPREGRVVVGLGAVDERDVRLALLTRPDLAFSEAFPSDAVVVAVGGDRFVPVYGPGAGQVVGGLDELGEQHLLSRGGGREEPDVQARFATIPSSTIRVGAYLGPDVRAERAWTKVDGLLGSFLVRQPDPAEAPPSDASLPDVPPGFNADPDEAREDARSEVLRIGLDDGAAFALRVGERCALVVDETSGGSRAVGGDCELPRTDLGAREVLAGTAFFFSPPDPSLFGPGERDSGSRDPDSGAMWAVGRAGHAIERVGARLVNGQMQDVRLVDGWFLAVTEGRIAELLGYDASGAPVASAWVD